ncbi:MAG: peptide chain release factor aRF-1 [Candidatus Bathyarchaeota archaeon]|nr:peptide chain release factor aRF-1 [Candidatus Bathyarchaeota archaeon]
MTTKKRSSLERFRLKRSLKTLASKEGRGTELVTLYVPPGRQISEVMTMLRNEYGTASNIKSDTTRKNVQDAITKTQQRLKLFKKIPKTGLVIFSGAIPKNGGPGSERMETYVMVPPEPVQVYLYRCDARFHTEYLEEFLKEKETYGIMVIDATATTYATLQGRRLEIIQDITSGVPGKFRAGGQSARRFERQREAKLQEYFKRIGNHADENFLPIEDLKGIIVGGPGPTKYDFQKGDYLHYTLKDKVLATVDTSYTGRQGVDEVMAKTPKILQRVRYVEEKRIIQEFLYEIGHDTNLATYGENEVRNALQKGAVKTLLLSEGVDVTRVTVSCTSCNYTKEETMKERNLLDFQQSLNGKPCPKCKAPTLSVTETKDLIDNFAEMAEQVGSDVEVISVATEEGQMLKDSFGGIASILRFSLKG